MRRKQPRHVQRFPPALTRSVIVSLSPMAQNLLQGCVRKHARTVHS